MGVGSWGTSFQLLCRTQSSYSSLGAEITNIFVHIYLTFLKEDKVHDALLSLLCKATATFVFFRSFPAQVLYKFFLDTSLCTMLLNDQLKWPYVTPMGRSLSEVSVIPGISLFRVPPAYLGNVKQLTEGIQKTVSILCPVSP